MWLGILSYGLVSLTSRLYTAEREPTFVKSRQNHEDIFCGGCDLNEGFSHTAISLGACQHQSRHFHDYASHRPGPTKKTILSSKTSDFNSRPAGFSCTSSSKILGYCRATAPYYSKRNNPASHWKHGSDGQAAFKFSRADWVKQRRTTCGDGYESTRHRKHEASGIPD